jgi:trehalose/maltose transport system substrate-binding protein
VKFLLHEEAELEAASTNAELPTGSALYRLPTILKGYSRSASAGQPLGGGIVSRPSAVTGRSYEDVSHAYAEAVHSVLTGKNRSTDAAAELETELERITGFPKGPPEAT